MALIRRKGDIEIYEIDENLSKFTRKQREQIINDLFRNKYIGKEVKYFLVDKDIFALINGITRGNFLTKNHTRFVIETNKEFKARLDIVASGDYLDLIKNVKYVHSKREEKPNQNDKHKSNVVYHYFEKIIIFNEIKFILKVCIREDNGKFYVYNTRLKETIK